MGPVIELPGMLLVLFLGLFFPLLDLASIGIGHNHLFNAARGASERAGRANTFTEGKDVARAFVDSEVRAFGGLKVHSVRVDLLEANGGAGSAQGYVVKQGPLPDDYDTSGKIYQVQVGLDGTVAPLLMVPFPLDVPGLTAPLPVHTVSRNFVENVDGLSN